MTINDPIVIWGLGVLVAFVGALIARMDHRVSKNAEAVSQLEQQMAGHDADRAMLDRMYNELQALTRLTSRIAGHLNIS
jgi:hypothetical protein